jgi:hypothetical protein
MSWGATSFASWVSRTGGWAERLILTTDPDCHLILGAVMEILDARFSEPPETTS